MISTRFTLPVNNLSESSPYHPNSIKTQKQSELTPKESAKIGTVKRYRKLIGLFFYLIKHSTRHKIITEQGKTKTVYFNKTSARKRSLQMLLCGELPTHAQMQEKSIARMFLEKVLGPQTSPYLNKMMPEQRIEPTAQLRIPANDPLLHALNEVSPVPVVRYNTGNDKDDTHNLQAVLAPGDVVFVNRERDHSHPATVLIRWSQKLCKRGIGARRFHNTTHIGMIHNGHTICEASDKEGCWRKPINTLEAVNFPKGTDTEYLVYRMTDRGKKFFNVDNMLQLMERYAKADEEKRTAPNHRSLVDNFKRFEGEDFNLKDAKDAVVDTFRANIEYCKKRAFRVMFKSNTFDQKAKVEMIRDMLSAAYALPYPVNEHGKVGHICSSFAASIMQAAQHQEIRELIQARTGSDPFALENDSVLAQLIALQKNTSLSPKMRAKADKAIGKMLTAKARQIVAEHGELLSKDNVAFPFRAHYNTPRDMIRFVTDHPEYFQVGARIIPSQYPERR